MKRQSNDNASAIPDLLRKLCPGLTDEELRDADENFREFAESVLGTPRRNVRGYKGGDSREKRPPDRFEGTA